MYPLNKNPAYIHEGRLINWKFPLVGCVKINTTRETTATGALGGLEQIGESGWKAYCGVHNTLMLCKERNWHVITVASDCQIIVNLINKDNKEESHLNQILIDDCKELKNDMHDEVIHIMREANRCADVPANMGSEQLDQEVRLLVPPNEILEEMQCDECQQWKGHLAPFFG